MREALEKKKMRRLKRESCGEIERASRVGKGRRSKTLHAGSCKEREKLAGTGEQ